MLFPEGDTLVLGIGNLLWADEGFGVRAAEALQARYHLPPDILVVDGGTQGLALIPWLRAARRVIVLDAVDLGLAPGALTLLRDAEIPRLMGARRLSLHQTTFMDVLAAVELLGGGPEAMWVVGVQPGELDDFGGGLTPPVAAALEGALEQVITALVAWGHMVPSAAIAAPPASGRDINRSE